MAWYYGTFSCGCEGRVNVIGPTKDRQWKVDRKFEGLCEECYIKKLEADRKKANKEAEEKAKEMELPNLTGSEKQIAWANTLRQKFIDNTEVFIKNSNEKDRKYEWKKCREKYEKFNEIELSDLYEVLDYVLINETQSKFYIDNRMNDITDILAKYVDKVFVSKEKKIEDMNKRDIKLESTVSPKEVKHSGIVEIIKKEDKIIAKYEKNEDFRLIVKSLGYTWEGQWEKKITTITGKYEDRIAEIGNKLLNEGFNICIYDEYIRHKAISGNFEPENDRWILIDTKNEDRIRIRWDGMNNSLYNVAKKLPGAKWEDKGMKVNIDKYEEIFEFAEIYGFNITEKATERLINFKRKFENIEKVNVAVVEEINKKDGLNDILNSSREILNDLLDD